MTDRALIAQLDGYGLTTAEIHYYRPDHPSLLQLARQFERLILGRCDPLPLAGTAADCDLARLHRFGNDAVEFDREQPVGEACAAHLDIVGQLQAPFEFAARDAAVEIGASWRRRGSACGDWGPAHDRERSRPPARTEDNLRDRGQAEPDRGPIRRP